ncbi:unnamed protein product [Sphenostylis stenocarpa]|uniref:Uncharacterized protein n=1 Tax=Sphenostylis stenocarpa TaxID=92480 RepID=A0AA86SPH1_9FABA|nr:unnamed protein product [Sphenostylis stenocarpa]
MFRFFSPIRHGRGSSLISLLAPKPALPFDAAMRPRCLPQNDGTLRISLLSLSSFFKYRNESTRLLFRYSKLRKLKIGGIVMFVLLTASFHCVDVEVRDDVCFQSGEKRIVAR